MVPVACGMGACHSPLCLPASVLASTRTSPIAPSREAEERTRESTDAGAATPETTHQNKLRHGGLRASTPSPWWNSSALSAPPPLHDTYCRRLPFPARPRRLCRACVRACVRERALEARQRNATTTRTGHGDGHDDLGRAAPVSCPPPSLVSPWHRRLIASASASVSARRGAIPTGALTAQGEPGKGVSRPRPQGAAPGARGPAVVMQASPSPPC